MLRGFTREVLSILSWVAALAAAVFAFLNPEIRGLVQNLVQPDWLADGVLVVFTFILVLIVISFITARLTDFILDSRVGAIDRTFGLAFGVARGVVLVAVAYLFLAWLLPEDQQPSWVRNAQARPYMEQSRDVLLSFLPEDPSDMIDWLPQGVRDLLDPEEGQQAPESESPTLDGVEPDPAGGGGANRLPAGGGTARGTLLVPASGAMQPG